MGTCVFQIHYHNNETENNLNEESKPKNNKEYEISSHNIQIPSSQNEKIKKKLTSNSIIQGKFVSKNEFQFVVGEKIIEYIKSNKLDYQKYISSIEHTYLQEPYKFKNGNIYYGNWNKNCEMEGYGNYYVKTDNLISEGIWIKGNLIFGRLFFNNGDIYEGEIKKSFPNGKGKMFYQNGEKYEGNFENGEQKGKGIFIFLDKTIYEGNFENGIFNGEGKMKWKNGTEYIGNFIESSLSGKGEIVNIQKEKYVGDFKKNEFHGKGIYYDYKSREEYNGYFECGLRKGKGIYKRKDGIIFDGEWDNDLPNGNGVIKNGNNKLKGFWRNGNYVEGKEISDKTFDNLNKNIFPFKINIYPSSLPHLEGNDVNTSQISSVKELDFF